MRPTEETDSCIRLVENRSTLIIHHLHKSHHYEVSPPVRKDQEWLGVARSVPGAGPEVYRVGSGPATVKSF